MTVWCCCAGQCIHAFGEWTRLLICLVSESTVDLLSVSCQSTVRLLLSVWKWDTVFKNDCNFWCCKNTLQQSWRSARLCILIIWSKIHCGGVWMVYNWWCILCEARHHNQEAPLYNKMLTSKAPVGPSQHTVGRKYRWRQTVSSAEARHILI